MAGRISNRSWQGGVQDRDCRKQPPPKPKKMRTSRTRFFSQRPLSGSNLSPKLDRRRANARRENLRVLVVEDHPAIARGLKALLGLRQCQVEVASDMHAALALASEIEFDVLLCDLNLPDGTGWELMAKLGERARSRGVAYSALDQPEHVIRSQQAGFSEHLVKGCDPDELVAAIARVFEGKGRLDERSQLLGDGD